MFAVLAGKTLCSQVPSFDNNHDSNGSSKTSPITKIIIRKFPM